MIEYLQDIMDYKGWTQKDLAIAMGVSPSRVSEIMKGDAKYMTISIAIRLAKLCLKKWPERNPSFWIKFRMKQEYANTKKQVDKIRPV